MIYKLPRHEQGTAISVPVLTPDQVKTIKAYIEIVEKTDDEDCAKILKLLYNKVYHLEACAVNLEKTLKAYRKVIPRLVYLRSQKIKKEV